MTKQTTRQQKQKESENGGSGFFTGLLLGGLTGAGVMLLLAPQSGRKTRAQLQKQGNLLRKQTMKTVEEGVSQVQTKAHDLSTTLQKQAEELQERGQTVLDNSKERVATVVHDGKERLSNAVNDGKERLSNVANDVSKAVQTGKAAINDATA